MALPAETVQVSYLAGQGSDSASFTGARLLTVFDAAGGPQLPTDTNNAKLRVTILVTAADGYQVAFGWGELDPEYGAVTPQWGDTPERHYTYLTNTSLHGGLVPNTVSELVAALRRAIGANEMLAYIVEMAVRLVELRRVLSSTGSLYLHCDPTASHYLKIVLDAIFGPTRFRNEIVWKRSDAHNDATQGARRYGRIHDVLLFCTCSDEYTFNTEWLPLSTEIADKWYRHVDTDGRRYTLPI